MQTRNLFRAFFGISALTSVVGLQGCVADRPSRNGVFNENQYVRKDFLVRPGADGSTDTGWYMKGTIVQTSTPNPLANLGIFNGAENSGALVRFVITSNKLLAVDMRELSQTAEINAQDTRIPSTINTWPVTNVDLKYQINLDGEKTNFYQENQELDWQVRQWVKLNFDKNDFSDIAGLGQYQEAFLQKCATGDTAATLVPNSFLVDDKNDYMEWTVNVATGVKMDDADCVAAYGSAGTDYNRLGRSSVSFNVKYSLVRAKPVDPAAYTPLVIAEKDAIRHKYGPIEVTNWSRDYSTGLLAARQLTLRFNPAKPIVFYFAKGYPQERKDMWTRPGGIVEQTNGLFTQGGAAARLSVLNFNDDKTLGDGAGPVRNYGDVRYNFIRWESDLDTGSPFIGVAQFQPDLRTGELVSASINIADGPLKDFLAARTAAYLQLAAGKDLFADPPPDPTDPSKTLSATCTAGQQIPLISTTIQKNVYSQSSLYQRMASYLPTPPDGATTGGPSDYVKAHTGPDGDTFFKAYMEFVPYITYADPLMNQFTQPADLGQPAGAQMLLQTLSGEAKFRKVMSDIEHGAGLAVLPTGPAEAYKAVDNMRQLWQAHRDYEYTWQLPRSTMQADTADLINFPATMARSSRHCVNGKWESRADWEKAMLDSYYEGVVWHEFGHIMGMEHNFMGSVDRANWPQYKAADGTTQYGKLSSSIMEYAIANDDVYWNNGGDGKKTGWLPYDQGAIAFIYGNNLSASAVGPTPAPPPPGGTPISGQVSNKAPWNDPAGFNGATEKAFLFCSHQHIRYTPLCRQFDLGSTPSEITAADIERYEWNYKWRNFRNYYKVWDDSAYSTVVANILADQRRFIALEAFDWSTAELTDKLIRIGIDPPVGSQNAGNFYQQLTNHFISDVQAAEQMSAAFHEAIVQQGTGQRPFQTQYDPYFGDVTQQGIATDKALAFTQWLGLWPFDNYDPTQSAGYYASSMTVGPAQTHPAQAWSTAGSMLGEKGAWDAYPAFFPTAVALFAHDTQTPTFTGLGFPQMRDWIGGRKFIRLQDALDYFRQIAAANPLEENGCAQFEGCTYDPMTPSIGTNDIGHSNPVTQAFIGPDHRRYTWAYLADRHIWYFVDQDRNTSAYTQVFNYNYAINTLFNDGNNDVVYGYQARIKYMIDAYDMYNNGGGNVDQ